MYEIIFSYYEKTDTGYDTTNKLETKKVLGKKKEVTLEDAAGFIIGQLSRRDIFIFDTKVYELALKQISFKESKDSIILKNKKFSLGNTGSLIGIDISENDESEVQEKTVVKKQISVPAKSNPKFLREEVFGLETPEGSLKASGFTHGKKYKIVAETKDGDYIVINDRNVEQKISPLYFNSSTPGIKFDGEVFIPPDAENTSKIVYGGQLVDDSGMRPLR